MGGLFQQFAPALSPPEILAGDPILTQLGHLAETSPPNDPRVLPLGDIEVFHPCREKPLWGSPQTPLPSPLRDPKHRTIFGGHPAC